MESDSPQTLTPSPSNKQRNLISVILFALIFIIAGSGVIYFLLYGPTDVGSAEVKQIAWENAPTDEDASSYWKDANHVYLKTTYPTTDYTDTTYPMSRTYLHGYIQIPLADPNTFEIFPYKKSYGDIYAKDKTRVFVGTETLMEADSGSFRPLGNGYAKDSHHVFFGTEIIPFADPNTFTLIGEFYGHDATKVYWRTQVVNGANPTTAKEPYAGLIFLIDETHVFQGTNQLSFDPATFELKTTAIADGHQISYFNIAGKVHYSFNSLYSSDFPLIAGADPATFQVSKINNDSDNNEQFFAQDKNNFYCRQQVVLGVTPSNTLTIERTTQGYVIQSESSAYLLDRVIWGGPCILVDTQKDTNGSSVAWRTSGSRYDSVDMLQRGSYTAKTKDLVIPTDKIFIPWPDIDPRQYHSSGLDMFWRDDVSVYDDFDDKFVSIVATTTPINPGNARYLKPHEYRNGFSVVNTPLNPETFSLLKLRRSLVIGDGDYNPRYASDRNGVYIRYYLDEDSTYYYDDWKKIAGADPETFRVIDGGYSADSHSVYFNDAVVEGADHSSFALINPAEEPRYGDSRDPISVDYGRDSTHVYLAGKVIPDLSPSSVVETFSVAPVLLTSDAIYWGYEKLSWTNFATLNLKVGLSQKAFEWHWIIEVDGVDHSINCSFAYPYKIQNVKACFN